MQSKTKADGRLDAKREAVQEATDRLYKEIAAASDLAFELVLADPWVVSSLLQKSIRRGESGASPAKTTPSDPALSASYRERRCDGLPT